MVMARSFQIKIPWGKLRAAVIKSAEDIAVTAGLYGRQPPYIDCPGKAECAKTDGRAAQPADVVAPAPRWWKMALVRDDFAAGLLAVGPVHDDVSRRDDLVATSGQWLQRRRTG